MSKIGLGTDWERDRGYQLAFQPANQEALPCQNITTRSVWLIVLKATNIFQVCRIQHSFPVAKARFSGIG